MNKNGKKQKEIDSSSDLHYQQGKSRPNLAKGDIAPLILLHMQSQDFFCIMQKKSCRYLLSYSQYGTTWHEVGPGIQFEPHLGEGEVVRVSHCTIRNSDGGFLLGSPFYCTVSVTIRPQFAIECLRRWNQQSMLVGQTGAKFGKERVDRCKPNFNTIWESFGAVLCKKMCWYLLPFHHNVRAWQTDHGAVISIPIGEIAFGDVV